MTLIKLLPDQGISNIYHAAIEVYQVYRFYESAIHYQGIFLNTYINTKCMYANAAVKGSFNAISFKRKVS